MRSVTIDRTNLQVSRWSLGTGSLHHLLFSGERQRLLDCAVDVGFTHFDTAPYYGYGLAELALGRLIQHQRLRVTVATKVGLYPPGASAKHGLSLWSRKASEKIGLTSSRPRIDWCVSTAEKSLDASLQRLRTDYVDLLFLHEPDPVMIATDEFLDWLAREVQRGRVRYWGLAGAGLVDSTWVNEGSLLANVLQIQDSVDTRNAEGLVVHGRSLQFTYGYLSKLQVTEGPDMTPESLQNVLKCNSTGSILVSTRGAERLRDFATASELEPCK